MHLTHHLYQSILIGLNRLLISKEQLKRHRNVIAVQFHRAHAVYSEVYVLLHSQA